MKRKNKYIKNAHISEGEFRLLLKCFCADLQAVQTAQMTGLNRNTVNRYFHLLRQRLAALSQAQATLEGHVEVDESYFGKRRTKGKRGRGAYGKTIVFGLYERQGKVFTEIVPDCSKATLQAVIRGRVSLDSVIHSDGFRGYDGLVDLGYQKHLRVNHGKDEFVRGKAHVNGLEGFWGLAKVRLSKFRGVPPKTFFLHLKETEFRFNHRHQNLYLILLRELRNYPLN